MKRKELIKVLAVGMVITCCVQTAHAKKVLKLGTVGFIGMPIGDAIDQALIPTLEEVSGGAVSRPVVSRQIRDCSPFGQVLQPTLVTLAPRWQYSICLIYSKASKMLIVFQVNGWRKNSAILPLKKRAMFA